MKYKLALTIFILISSIISHSLSQENEIKIISNELKIDTDKNISTFIGDVNATNQNLKMWSDKMIITLKEDNDNVKEILAIGNVKIIRIFEGTEIYGEVANYSIENEIITIDKNVIIIEDGNEVRGSQLIVDLKNSSSIMTASDSNRVEAIILNN
tara:strand:- start:804 stop:1268 length:465 start_codon:yes stop_codon:yes gene_type:complete